ncbi:MAG: ABC transporter substrate-binding protein [Acidilobaceae archaeon]|nr:ABC transporter substrate-binding protein [Acidilobaceae archaeon]MCX8165855.1 ABC transporter substrate-binding protein [Acidilobaceae archaeon]MDW7974863.1 ABC transporter substrate-binding protein [Sulfolobales archaeon]
MRRVALVGLVIVLALIALLLLPGREEEQQAVRIGVVPTLDALPFFIAEAEGLFEKHGIKANVTVYASARDMDVAFQAGLVDVGIYDMIRIGISVDKGANIKVAGLLLGELPEDGVFAMVAPPGSTGKPKTIAISRNTIVEFVSSQLIPALGLKPGEFELVDVPPITTRFELVMGGKVDAAILPDPWWRLAVERGARVVIDDSMLGKSISVTVIGVKGELATPELARKIRAALNEALELYRKDPGKYRGLIEQKIFVPEELKGKWLPSWKGSIKDYPRDNFELVSAWLLEKGLVSKPLKYEDTVMVLDR